MVKNEPVLRFSEFNQPWSSKTLGETTHYVKGFAFKSADYRNEGIRIVRVSDLDRGSIKTENEKVFISNEQSHLFDKYVIKKGNIIITTVGSKPEMLESAVGRGIYVNNENEGLLNQNLLKFENLDDVNNKFLSCYINSPKYINHIISIQRGNANQSNITVKNLLDFKVAIPEQKEQQKIADFLSSVDNKIRLLTEKQSQLQRYKKGVMQKLFSQELRFKDENGEDFGDWEENRLDDVAQIIGGGTPATTEETYWSGDINWFTPTEIKTKYLTESKRQISEEGLKKSSAKELPIGTLLLSTRATVGEIGIAKEKCSTNQGFQSLIIKKDHVNEFWYYWILKNKKELLRRSSGSTFLEINKKEISKIPALSPDKSEQQKIANFLSEIDKKTDSVNMQIEQTKIFKKGLLQKMFV